MNRSLSTRERDPSSARNRSSSTNGDRERLPRATTRERYGERSPSPPPARRPAREQNGASGGRSGFLPQPFNVQCGHHGRARRRAGGGHRHRHPPSSSKNGGHQAEHRQQPAGSGNLARPGFRSSCKSGVRVPSVNDIGASTRPLNRAAVFVDPADP